MYLNKSRELKEKKTNDNLTSRLYLAPAGGHLGTLLSPPLDCRPLFASHYNICSQCRYRQNHRHLHPRTRSHTY